jgi:hypothetical protein
VLPTVTDAVTSLRKAFPEAVVEVNDDGSGGAYVVVHPVTLGGRFAPSITWVGGHITAQFPYSDIYPIFIGGDVRLANGAAFVPPITSGHTFRGRAALQISRRTNRLDPVLQSAACKFQKVIYWLIHQT